MGASAGALAPLLGRGAGAMVGGGCSGNGSSGGEKGAMGASMGDMAGPRGVSGGGKSVGSKAGVQEGEDVTRGKKRAGGEGAAAGSGGNDQSPSGGGAIGRLVNFIYRRGSSAGCGCACIVRWYENNHFPPHTLPPSLLVPHPQVHAHGRVANPPAALGGVGVTDSRLPPDPDRQRHRATPTPRRRTRPDGHYRHCLRGWWVVPYCPDCRRVLLLSAQKRRTRTQRMWFILQVLL